MDRLTSEVTSRAFDLFAQKAVSEILYFFDKNNDELISKHEFLCFTVSLRIDIKEANTCFKALDLNHDMKINRSELLYAIKGFFLSNDPDHPGNLLFGHSHSDLFTTRNNQIY